MAFSCSYNSSAGAILVLVLLFSSTHNNEVEAAQDALLPICKTVGGGSTFVGIDFCMGALGSDSRSRNAEGGEDLSIIAIDISTAAKINGLLLKGGNVATVKCLRPCQALYRGIKERLPGSTAAVKSGKLGEAKSSLEQSASAANECENGFGKSHVASPLTVEDDNALKLAKLAAALLP